MQDFFHQQYAIEFHCCFPRAGLKFARGAVAFFTMGSWDNPFGDLAVWLSEKPGHTWTLMFTARSYSSNSNLNHFLFVVVPIWIGSWWIESKVQVKDKQLRFKSRHADRSIDAHTHTCACLQIQWYSHWVRHTFDYIDEELDSMIDSIESYHWSTVDGSEILNNHLWCIKTLYIMG